MRPRFLSSYFLLVMRGCIVTISRIKDASCPYRYFKEYVEKPKAQKAFVSLEAGIGKFFHSYLENRFKLVIARNETIGRDDVLDIGDLVRSFRLSFLWEGTLRAPYRIVRDTYNLGAFISRLESVGQQFNEFLTSRLVGHMVLAAEGQLQLRTDSFYVRGKHDLITQEPSGAFALWDWKTGRAPVPRFYEDFINQKIQLGIYAIWMKHQFEATSVRGTAVFLRDKCEELSEVFTPSIERDVLRYLHDWRSRLNGLSSYPPIPNNLCDWCGWNPVCPAHTSRVTSAFPRAAREQGGIGRPTIKKGHSCFVATCVFQNPDAHETRLLRRYRDEILSRSGFGNGLILAYERIGPVVAAILHHTNLGKAIVRALFEWIVVPMVRRRLKRPPSNWQNG